MWYCGTEKGKEKHEGDLIKSLIRGAVDIFWINISASMNEPTWRVDDSRRGRIESRRIDNDPIKSKFSRMNARRIFKGNTYSLSNIN